MRQISLPENLQASLKYGPAGEINIPSGKKGKIHMQIWSDTLERYKGSGKTKFYLIPLLDDDKTEASQM